MTTRFASNARVGKVDMTDDVNRPLFERFGVRRYPIIKFFHNGVELSSLGVVRDAAKIVEYLTSEKAKEVSIPACFFVFAEPCCSIAVKILEWYAT